MELLTGKNKEQFEKWYIEKRHPNNVSMGDTDEKIEMCKNRYMNFFYNELSFEMQIGVLLAYYKNLGYDVYHDACSCHTPSLYTFVIKNNKSEFIYYSYENLNDFNSPIEAYKEAFKKANDLVNENLK